MLVGLVMGSESDWGKAMQKTAIHLRQFGIPYEKKVVSAHRTPDFLFEYAEKAKGRLDFIIAGAGGAAHLPGMLAAKTTVPVLGVPIPGPFLQGLDALLSIAQMPRGVPVATFGVGAAGAINAAIFCVHLLAPHHPEVQERLAQYREQQRLEALNSQLVENWEIAEKE